MTKKFLSVPMDNKNVASFHIEWKNGLKQKYVGNCIVDMEPGQKTVSFTAVLGDGTVVFGENLEVGRHSKTGIRKND